MKIEIWSDIACPFCYIGERHLQLALESFEHVDDVVVVPRSFELDSTATPHEHRPMVDALAAKFGTSPEQVSAMQRGIAEQAQAVGLEFDTSNASVTNTFDAHRLVHLAQEEGRGLEMLRALMEAYFAHGLKAGDQDELVALATSVGLDETRVREVLAGEDYSDAVRSDESRAQMIGVHSVPFFLIEEKYAVSGAQPVEAFKSALDEVWAKENPVQILGDSTALHDASCTTDSCAVPENTTP